jgi:hypothetical protein
MKIREPRKRWRIRINQEGDLRPIEENTFNLNTQLRSNNKTTLSSNRRNLHQKGEAYPGKRNRSGDKLSFHTRTQCPACEGCT